MQATHDLQRRRTIIVVFQKFSHCSGPSHKNDDNHNVPARHVNSGIVYAFAVRDAPVPMPRILMVLFFTQVLCMACSDPSRVSEPDMPEFAGIYIFGHEVNSFKACGADVTYWVRSSGGIAGEIRSFHEANTDKPYQPVYLVFQGNLLDEEADGFAADYDGLIHIDRLLTLSATVPDDCG
jgi:hypothetical protein